MDFTVVEFDVLCLGVDGAGTLQLVLFDGLLLGERTFGVHLLACDDMLFEGENLLKSLFGLKEDEGEASRALLGSFGALTGHLVEHHRDLCDLSKFGEVASNIL